MVKKQIKSVAILMSIEWLDHNKPQNQALTVESAEQLLQLIASDLVSLFPAISQCGICLSGCPLSQQDVLQPGFPVFDALQQIFIGSLDESGGIAHQLSIGSSQGVFPHRGLSSQVASNGLSFLPILVLGEERLIADLSDAMEAMFLHRGAASSVLECFLSDNSANHVVHAGYMTTHDVCALTQLQMEAVGLDVLWQILEAALFPGVDEDEFVTSFGNAFIVRDQTVHTAYYSFAVWAEKNTGKPPSDSHHTYLEWSQCQRQFMSLLECHQVTLVVHQARVKFKGSEDLLALPNIECGYFIECRDVCVLMHQITEYTSPELGTLCIAVSDGSGQEMLYYPIEQRGLQAVNERILAPADSRKIKSDLVELS